jgi:PEP-CTERM motif-containing protein
MKKLILTVAMVAGVSMVAFSQGASMTVGNFSANGYVITDPAGHLSSSTASYTKTATFTVQLWALPGNVTSTAGLGIDAYGYITPSSTILATDGFVQVANIGNVAGGGSSGAGLFNDSTAANIIGSTGAFPYTAAASDVVALVAWTGTASTLQLAIAGGASVGILAFVNPLGPGGANPNIPDDSIGWNALANSPASAANHGTEDFILAPVPEPTTLALAGLGGAALLAIRRKKA